MSGLLITALTCQFLANAVKSFSTVSDSKSSYIFSSEMMVFFSSKLPLHIRSIASSILIIVLFFQTTLHNNIPLTKQYNNVGDHIVLFYTRKSPSIISANTKLPLYNKQGKFGSIVIASGLNFPDALSGGYLAYVKDAHIILTSPGNEYYLTPTTLSYNIDDSG